MVQNKGLIYKKLPEGWPIEGEHLAIEDRPFVIDTEPPEHGITTKNYYISFDPYQRGLLRDPKIKSYAAPYEIGEPIANYGVAEVIKSKNSIFQPGDLVIGRIGTEEYSVLPREILVRQGIQKLQNPYNLDPKLFLSALGMPGLTAYSSLYKIGEPKKGETIFISSAGGAVGQIVGQLAKIEGLKVIGSVGSQEKLDFIKNGLGFDGGFNYKTEKPREALTRLAPQGIDIYYENVGGETLDAALLSMNDFGRIVTSGMISVYNSKTENEKYGVKNLNFIISKRLKMQGFIVTDSNMGPVYTERHQKNVQKWIADGSFKTRESVTYGIDNAVKGLLGMFRGENFGKAILQIDEFKPSKSAKL